MPMRDEAAGSGGHGETRALLFEVALVTRGLKKDVQAGIAAFKELGDNWKQVWTGMDSTTREKLASVNQQILDNAAKQKAAMDDLVAKTTETMDARVQAAKDSYATETEALAETLAKQEASYQEAFNKIVSAQTEKVAKAEDLAKKEADSQIAQNQRATDAQLANIAKIREASLSSSAALPGPAYASAAGIGAIGTAVAGAGALQSQQEADAAARAEMQRQIEIAQEQAAGIAQAALTEQSEILTTARTTASELEATARTQMAALIATAQEQASGIVAEAEKQAAATTAALEAQKAELEATSSSWNRFTGMVGAAKNVLVTAVTSIALVGGALGIMYTLLNSAVTAVSDWAAEIVQASEAIGLNYKNTQVYLSLVEQFGVSHTIAETVLARFDKRLQENAGLFQQLGITAKDPNEALMQFITLVGSASNKAALFSEVLGGTIRSGSVQSIIDAFIKVASSEDLVLQKGYDLNGVILQQQTTLTGTAAGWERYAQLMDASGMLLSDSTVKAGALSQAIQTQLGMAFEGLKMKIGAAVLPDMQALELIIIALIQHTGDATSKTGELGDAFENIAKAIANALGYVVGFIAGIMGIKQADLNKIFTDAAKGTGTLSDATIHQQQVTEGLKNEITSLQQQEKDLTNTTKQQTEAIDNQITSLQNNQKAFDDAHNDKITAMQNEKTNYDDQLKLQDDLHQSYLVQLQDELAALQDSQNSRRQSGEDLASYETRLAEQSLQKSIQTEQNRRQTVSDSMQQQIDLAKQASDAEIEAYDNATQAQIQNLQAQKTALEDNLTQQQGILEQKIQDDQNTLNGSAAATTTTVETSASDLNNFIQAAIKAMQDSATNGGLTAGQNFVGNLTGAIKAGLSDLISLGEQAGGALVNGLLTAVGEKMLQSGAGRMFLNAIGQEAGIEHEVGQNLVDQLNLNRYSLTGLTGVEQQLNQLYNSGAISQGTWQPIQQLADSLMSQFNSKGQPIYGPGGAPFHDNTQYPIPNSGGLYTTNPLQHNAMGGIVGGPVLSWVGEAGPEAIIPLTNPRRAGEVMQQAGLGGHTFVTNFNGPVATRYVASQVMQQQAIEAQRSGLIFASGTGL